MASLRAVSTSRIEEVNLVRFDEVTLLPKPQKFKNKNDNYNHSDDIKDVITAHSLRSSFHLPRAVLRHIRHGRSRREYPVSPLVLRSTCCSNYCLAEPDIRNWDERIFQYFFPWLVPSAH